MDPVRIAIVGAGSRGLYSYAPYVKQHPERAQIVAVAEPREWFRNEAASQYSIPQANVFSDWRELLDKDKLADAVIIATHDAEHTEPCLAAIEKKYAVLLEKPMAPTEDECRKIVKAAVSCNVILAVCHVLRYTPYFQKIREVVQSGVLGQLATVRHAEQVAFWHYAHSYVRGKWRNEAESSPMILAKSCHDMDILLYMTGLECRALSSFGNLLHFNADHKPDGASERCIDCSVESECQYSAKRFYLDWFRNKEPGWPVDVITQDFSEEGILHALKDGPYGRCVYQCDNDVVDNQVVAFEFEGGVTANFTMNAFTNEESRKTELFGSAGELRGDGTRIVVTKFLDGSVEEFDFAYLKEGSGAGHMGGDYGIMHDFVKAVSQNDPSVLTSGPEVSLMSHLMAFAAERSRKQGSVEQIQG